MLPAMEATSSADQANRTVQIWTAVIAAVAGIVVAAIGLVGTLAATNSRITSSDASSTLASPGPTVTVTETAPGPTVAATDDGKEPATPGPPTIQHTDGKVSLSDSGDYVDLMAPASDPTWGAAGTDPPTHSLSYNVSNLWMSGTAWAKVDKKADFSACSTATGWDSSGLGEPQKLEDNRNYIRLDNGQFGTLEVTKVNSEQVTVAITIWTRA